MGRMLIGIGILLIVVGLLIHFDFKIPLGKLPGDIRIERERFRFYFPITTSILVSIILTLLIYLIRKLG